MQGDILQDVGIGPNPFLAGPGDPPAVMADAKAFTRAFSAPVPVAELEVLRARHNVARVAAMLRHLGLTAESERVRSEEHTSELQSLMRNTYAVFCLNKHTSTL